MKKHLAMLASTTVVFMSFGHQDDSREHTFPVSSKRSRQKPPLPENLTRNSKGVAMNFCDTTVLPHHGRAPNITGATGNSSVLNQSVLAVPNMDITDFDGVLRHPALNVPTGVTAAFNELGGDLWRTEKHFHNGLLRTTGVQTNA